MTSVEQQNEIGGAWKVENKESHFRTAALKQYSWKNK